MGDERNEPISNPDDFDPSRWIPPPAAASEKQEKASGAKPDGCDHQPEWPVLSLTAMHGTAGEFCARLLPETESDQAALLFQLLTAAGNIIGPDPHYRVERSRHPCRLYVLLIGETSKARKGTSLDNIRAFFEDVDPEWHHNIGSGLSSGEGLIHFVRDPEEQAVPKAEKGTGNPVVLDRGVSDKRLLVTSSEFATLLKIMIRPGNTLSPVMRDAWDSGNLRNMTKNSPERATGAHVSHIGHITIHELRRHLDETEIANGFANRYLFVLVRRSRFLPFGGRWVEWRDLVVRFRERIERAKGLGEIGMNDAARERWRTVYRDLSEGRPGMFGAVIARAEAQVMRISLTFALLDGSSQITLEHLDAGLACWNYAEASARFVFGDALGDSIADTIFAAIKRNPDGLTQTAISDLLGRNISSSKISVALGVLATAGLVVCKTKSTRGRPTTTWFRAGH
jgi:hypothetical protein